MRDGGPAFPTIAGQTVYSHGMTLRDWFAGQALTEMSTSYHGSAIDPAGVASACYEYADAMMVARSAEDTEQTQGE